MLLPLESTHISSRIKLHENVQNAKRGHLGILKRPPRSHFFLVKEMSFERADLIFQATHCKDRFLRFRLFTVKSHADVWQKRLFNL